MYRCLINVGMYVLVDCLIYIDILVCDSSNCVIEICTSENPPLE